MKRRFFLVAGAGSLALARLAGVPAFAASSGSRRVVANGALRTSIDGGVPGGCYARRNASMSSGSGYTLAFALGRQPRR